jgi:hypothetical protein
MTCKVFFDTQVCINAAKRQINEADWAKATRHVQETAEYYVSPPTLGEILTSIAKGDGSHFEEGKERLRRLCLPGRKFFDFPEYFLGHTLGFQIRRPGNLDSNFGFDVSGILLADSKADLSTGVPLRSGGFALVKLDKFLAEMERSKQTYVSLFSILKGSKKPDFSPKEWASSAMTGWGLERDEASLTKFINGLSAAYEYELALHNLVRNSNYDLRKHISDVIDARQLIYLCDPEVVFVTDDAGFKKRLRENAQNHRILTFSELLGRAHDGQSILRMV